VRRVRLTIGLTLLGLALAATTASAANELA
jgi:hypothetical protein